MQSHAFTENTRRLLWIEDSAFDFNVTVGERFLNDERFEFDDVDLKVLNYNYKNYYFPKKDGNSTLTLQEFVSEISPFLTESKLFNIVDVLFKLELEQYHSAFLQTRLALIFLYELLTRYFSANDTKKVEDLFDYLIKKHAVNIKQWDDLHSPEVTDFIARLLPRSFKSHASHVAQVISHSTTATSCLQEHFSELEPEYERHRLVILKDIAHEKQIHNVSVSNEVVTQLIEAYQSRKWWFFSSQSQHSAKLISDLKNSKSDFERGQLLDSFMQQSINSSTTAYRVIRDFFGDRYTKGDNHFNALSGRNLTL